MTPNPNPSPELMACPFCGSAEVYPQNGDAWRRDTGTPFQFIWCIRCNTKGAEHPTEAEAITAWNTRAALSQTLPAPGEVEHIADAGNMVEVECIRRAIWGYVNAQPEDAAMLPLVQFLANRDVFLAEAIALATVAAANDEGVAEHAAQFADGVAEGAQSLYALAARDRDTVGTLIHGEAVRVAKHIASAIRLLPQGAGK